MDRTHFIPVRAPRDTDFADDEPFIFEVEDTPNPMDSDDPEVAYHEYLAQRFATR